MAFEEIAERFWDTGSDYLVQEPLTDDALRAAEAELGVRLPEEYVALLRIRNGGVVSKQCSAFPTSERTSWAEGWVGFQEMHGIGPDFQTILSSPYLTDVWGLPGTAVLLSGDGHWWIALDYRGGDEPVVTWFDTEWEQDMQLAASFRAFVENGRRNLENTRLWPRDRCGDVLGQMWPWQTRRLRAALREVEAAQTPAELVERMRAIEPELDRLLRPWIRKRRPGWASDERRLRELSEGPST
jgi:hypothetical protein